MARFDGQSSEVQVFTFKEGLLSAVAHDLKLGVRRFTIDEEAGHLRAECEASSLGVLCAMKNGIEASGSLSESMKTEIEKNIVHDVLESRKFPTIRFESSRVDSEVVEGTLTLRGVSKPVRGTRKDGGGKRIAEFRIDQREFGMKPFSAMLGTLKIKPEVLVVVSLPA